MVEAGFEPRACTHASQVYIQSPQTVLRGPREAQEVQEALWVGNFLGEGLMEPGLQAAGRVQLCSSGFPSVLGP